MDNNAMILVSGFIKKTKKTPQAELELSRKRKKQYELK
jgi:phage-related protein